MKELLSEFIYGGMDGIITTVAIISATLGANIHTKYALILGLANIIADGFSMGISRYNSLTDLRQMGNSIVSPLQSALYTFLFFIIMGSIPLIPFLFVSLHHETKMRNMLFLFSLFAFIMIGAIKGQYTKKRIRSMSEVVGIGLFGALISYFVAKYINSKIKFNYT